MLKYLAVNGLVGVGAFTLSAPALAADNLTLSSVLVSSVLPIKVIVAALIVSAVAALVIAGRKLSEPDLTGGSAYISALRLGAPLAGLAGAAMNAFWAFSGIASVGKSMPFAVFAPSLAEASLVLLLGLIVGVVAVVCQWTIEARIDRTVLKA